MKYLLILSILFVYSNPYKLYTNNNIFNYGDYIINYNYTTGQANYAMSIYRGLNYKNNSCSCLYPPKWVSSPNITCNDYTGRVVDRSHLIPFVEFGPITCELTNAVPMYPKLNRGSWSILERDLRQNYAGKLIIRGCKYNGSMINPPEVKKSMFLPLGCYYIVTTITTSFFSNDFNILEYGYLENLRNKTSDKIRELPWWIEESKLSHNNDSIIHIIIILSLVAFIFCLGIIGFIIIKYKENILTKISFKKINLYDKL